MYAARSLRREPALVVGVVLTFALAIGANAAMFGLVSRLLLPTPPGVTDPARVARVALNYRMDDGEEYAQSTTSYPLFRALASVNGAWVAVAAVVQSNLIMGRGADALEVSGPFGPHHVAPISVPGTSEPPSAGGQLPMMYGATPMYLELMGVSLLQGRLLGEQDRRGSAPVVLVNETMAREVWPGQSAIGKCIRAGFDPSVEPGPLAPASLPCREVVGIVRDSRARSLRPVGREASLMQFYVPFDQLPSGPFDEGGAAEVSGMLVGVSRDLDRIMPIVQRLIQGSSASPVYARVRQYQDLLDPQLRPWRLGATLFAALGALALSIAAVGLFGVVSYLVTQRTREIGLRLALGGTASSIGRSVVIAALRLVGIGVVVGIGIALAIGPVARALLFATSPHDVAVLLSAALALAGVTVAAAAVPAWRAARVSPMTALRVD